MKHVLIVLGHRPKKDGRPSDCMVSRVRTALALYKKNNYSKVILSGGGSIPEAELMRIMLLGKIPSSKIMVEKNSKDTLTNAIFSWELLKKNPPKSITIVTSDYHIRRTRYIFKRLYTHMNTNLKFRAAPSNKDLVERLGLRLKEEFALSKLKLFGIK